MKSHTKILLFSALDMWQEKIQNVQKLIVQIPYTLFSSKWMDTMKKLIEKKYLTLVPTNESKEKIKKYEELLSKIKDLTMSITKNDYDEKYMKISFRWRIKSKKNDKSS